jgi:putative salt-induced outer membrane protein YdiY
VIFLNSRLGRPDWIKNGGRLLAANHPAFLSTLWKESIQMFRKPTFALAIALAAGSSVFADEILFNNGDRLTGKIVSVEGDKMTIDTKLAGPIKVDTKEIKTFTSDAPIEIRTKGGEKITAKATAAEPGTVKVAGGAAGAPAKTVAVTDVKYINFSEAWTGDVVAGALFSRGNTFTDNANVAFDLTRRTEQDRWTFGGAYNFGRQRDTATGDKTTTTDNWYLQGKYDYFLNEKLYVFGSFRYEHDRIADLDRRMTPGGGLGYQWVETPTLSFNTEAGLAYVCEHYEDGDSNDFIAARLAYHAKRSFNDKVSLFHNLEYYPSLETLDDYLIIADAGLRVTLTSKMFAEYKLEFRYDSTPAVGASRSDLRHIVGVGWQF